MSMPHLNSPAARALDEFHEHLLAPEAAPLRPVSRANHVRRRGSLEQGRALEALGHAVEYLVDCGLFDRDHLPGAGNQDALRILKGCSRAVFLECPEVVPMGRRLGNWGQRMLARGRRRDMPPC